jgi:hypothetical protein
MPPRSAWHKVKCNMRCAQPVGDSLVDSVVSDNIPIFTEEEEEKFNEAGSSTVKLLPGIL